MMLNGSFILLIILCILVFYVVYVKTYKEGFQSTTGLEIVVANYEEKLDWLHKIDDSFYDKMIIYNKGSAKKYSEFKKKKGVVIQKLSNVGREGHTYLYHIVNNYDKLADVTMFLPGSTNTFYQKQAQFEILIDDLKKNMDSRIIGFDDPTYIKDEMDTFEIDAYRSTSEENNNANPETRLVPADIRPFGRWIKARFPNEKLTCIGYRGLAVASREDIQKRPKSFYQSLMVELNYNNPEVGHFVERAWPLILSIPDEKCQDGDFSRVPKDKSYLY